MNKLTKSNESVKSGLGKPGIKKQLCKKAVALKNAQKCVEQFKTGSTGDRMHAAYQYQEGKLWKAQGHASLKEAVEKEKLGVTYPSFLRLAKAGEVYENLTGEKCPASCVETALRPLTSLSEEEFDQVKDHIEFEEISLTGKSPKQVRNVILNALSQPFTKDDEYIDASDELVRVVTEKMANAELTSTTAINLVATAIANKVEKAIRESLTPKPTKAKKSKAKKSNKNS